MLSRSIRTLPESTGYHSQRSARPTTFVTPVGEFSYDVLTPAMRRAIASADEDGAERLRCTKSTGRALIELGLAERYGVWERLTHSGWNVAPYV
jgi:hypothetical protein